MDHSGSDKLPAGDVVGGILVCGQLPRFLYLPGYASLASLEVRNLINESAN